jgi:hypothetical protein
VSLNYRLSGVPCVFCDRPVDRIHVYVNAVVTVHESTDQPDCVSVHTAELRAGGAANEVPRSPTSSDCRIRDAA